MVKMMNKAIISAMSALAAGMGHTSDTTKIQLNTQRDTRVTKNTRRNRGTKARYKFIHRVGSGNGMFLNSRTRRVELHGINSGGLSVHARHHFGIPDNV